MVYYIHSGIGYVECHILLNAHLKIKKKTNTKQHNIYFQVFKILVFYSILTFLLLSA